VKAIIRDGGARSGLALADLPEPARPARGQVLVRMKLAPINPADRLAAAGNYAPLDGLAGPLGAEGMGVVEEVGVGVAGLAPGDHVILLSRGNWAERRLVAAAEVLPVAAALPPAQAAILRINPATAFHLLASLDLAPGDWLILNAAGSSVARWVRRLAARNGVRTLNVVRAGPAGEEGGLWLVDGDDLATRAGPAAGGAPIHAALDAVAGASTGGLAACLAPGGRLLVYGHLSGQPCAIPSALLTTKGLRVQGFSLRPVEAHVPDLAALYADLATLAAKDPEPIAAILPMAEVEAALAQPPRGRVLLALDR